MSLQETWSEEAGTVISFLDLVGVWVIALELVAPQKDTFNNNEHAIVDDMVYAGHNWIGLELEQLYDVNGKPNYAASRNDTISLVNIKTGEIIVMENPVFQKCQDLERLEVLGNNKAYFLCENSAYSLDLSNKEVTQMGNSQNDKFDELRALYINEYKSQNQVKKYIDRYSDMF